MKVGTSNIASIVGFLILNKIMENLGGYAVATVRNSGNKNSDVKFDGSSSGFVENCHNSLFKISDTQISASNNANCHVELGKCSGIEVNGNKNSKISGYNNTAIVFGGNANCNFLGNNWSNSKFTNNKNIDVSGDNNQITADDNSNIKISGSDNNLHLMQAFNLHIRREKNNCANKFQVENGQRYNKKNSWLSPSFWFGGVDKCKKPDIQYLAEYTNNASIKGDRYQLGGFEFQLTYNRKEVIIQLGSNYVVRPAGNDAVVVTAPPNEEELIISGPRIFSGSRQGEVRIPIESSNL